LPEAVFKVTRSISSGRLFYLRPKNRGALPYRSSKAIRWAYKALMMEVGTASAYVLLLSSRGAYPHLSDLVFQDWRTCS
jgi:hypothetical protein